MNSSKSFLERLLLKLKTGSSRSIHLNALPSRFARLDLYALVNIDQSMHLKFINQLLNKQKVKFKIEVDFKQIQKKTEEEVKSAKRIVKTLNSLYYQQQDAFLEHGVKTFAFGYPLLIKRDPKQPNKILKAPLLIWYLDIEKDLHHVNSWTITKNEEHPVIFNELLRTHIEANDKIKVDDIIDELELTPVDELSVIDLCKQILVKLGTTHTSFDTEIKVLPSTNKASIEKMTQNDPWIRWSGIFGLYKTQKQSIIQDIESLIQSYPRIPIHEHEYPPKETNSSTLSAVPLDPSQESILQQIGQEEQIIIQGPPGTGKSQTLTGIISNALYHGQTCLIVCEKKTAMDVIYQNLAAKQLDELCIIIDDVNRDRKKVVDKVRHSIEERKVANDDFRHFEFEKTINLHKQQKSDINRQLALLNKKCFGDYNLIGLIANVRKLKETTDYVPITDDLRDTIFDFSYERFIDLKSEVYKAMLNFGNLPHKSFAFNIVFDDHFKPPLDEMVNPHNDFLNIKEHTDRILEILNEELKDGGKLFNQISPFNRIKIGVGAIYSKKIKRIKAAQSLILSEWKILLEHFYEKIYFHHIFPKIDAAKTFSSLEPSLRALKGKIDQLIKDEKHFNQYYKWRNFNTQQPENVRILLSILSEKVNKKEWQNSFEIYYKEGFIKRYIEEFNLDNSIKLTIEHLTESTQYIEDNIAGKIKTIWDDQQKSVLYNRTISKLKHLYNYRRNKAYGKVNSLRKIVQHDFELFSNTFPVVMVNPSVCSSLFPLEKDLFDIVLFDEASQLRIEDTFSALLRGKNKIVSGDKHQMPPSSYFHSQVALFIDDDNYENDEITDDFLAASNSLLDFCMDSDFSATYLDFHYRSEHPDLIQFSNEAFYGGRLVPMPSKNNFSPIEYFQVNGIYTKSRTNLIEANAVVDYIYQNIQVVDDKYPSVGIATFNINQRNLIWDLLMERTYENEQYSVLLEKLIEQGLFVKNLENVQGDERDIILISTTFGPNKDGQFKQLFGPITQHKGYQLLNVIVSRAKQKIALFTSIPEVVSSKYATEISEKGNSGKGIFYAYLHYAKAVSENQKEKQLNILNLLNSYCTEGNFKHQHKSMTLFHQQIYTILVEQFGETNIAHNYIFGGFVLELCILKDNQPIIAISTEHLLYTDNTAYKMLQYKQAMLENYGIKTYAISTVAWQEDWKSEKSNLIKFISKFI